MRHRKPACPAGFFLPAAPRPAVCPVPVAPNAYPRPAARRSRGIGRRVVIWSRVVRVGIAPAPTIAEPKSKPESGTPTPAAAPVASSPPRVCAAGHERQETENQNCACEKSCQPRHRCTSGAASPFAKPTLYHRRAGLYSHQQRICGTITGPLTRYSCASHERHCRLAFGPR